MKNDRLFQTLYLLLEQGRMNAPELAERLKVSVRTVYRDVETLSMMQQFSPSLKRWQAQ